jgi:hypothetical protein
MLLVLVTLVARSACYIILLGRRFNLFGAFCRLLEHSALCSHLETISFSTPTLADLVML